MRWCGSISNCLPMKAWSLEYSNWMALIEIAKKAIEREPGHAAYAASMGRFCEKTMFDIPSVDDG